MGTKDGRVGGARGGRNEGREVGGAQNTPLERFIAEDSTETISGHYHKTFIHLSFGFSRIINNVGTHMDGEAAALPLSGTSNHRRHEEMKYWGFTAHQLLRSYDITSSHPAGRVDGGSRRPYTVFPLGISIRVSGVEDNATMTMMTLAYSEK